MNGKLNSQLGFELHSKQHRRNEFIKFSFQYRIFQCKLGHWIGKLGSWPFHHSERIQNQQHTQKMLCKVTCEPTKTNQIGTVFGTPASNQHIVQLELNARTMELILTEILSHLIINLKLKHSQSHCLPLVLWIVWLWALEKNVGHYFSNLNDFDFIRIKHIF